jgi:5-formyltetrahydrofolate cyclo-ligase
MTEHDIPLNAIVTPEKIIELAPAFEKPEGLYWSFLPKEKIDAIPVLKKRQRA